MNARLYLHRVTLICGHDCQCGCSPDEPCAMPLGKLTEADLNAHEAERLPVPAPRPPIEPIKSVEQDHPWLWAVYAAGALASFAISCAAPYWVQP